MNGYYFGQFFFKFHGVQEAFALQSDNLVLQFQCQVWQLAFLSHELVLTVLCVGTANGIKKVFGRLVSTF